MRALLDTCTFVWLIGAPDRVPPATRSWVERDVDSVLVSVASVWELSIKRRLGKVNEVASLTRDLAAFVTEALNAYLFQELRIDTRHAVLAGDLPLHHRDPFDRMLAAQAQIEDLVIVSPDPAFDPYGVTRRWD